MEPAERELESSFGKRFARGLRASACDNGSAYGYSVMITAAFGLLSATESTPGVLNVFAFAGGAIVAFGLVEALASGGFRHRLQDEPSEVKALGSSLAFLSVGLALTVVLGAGRSVPSSLRWSTWASWGSR